MAVHWTLADIKADPEPAGVFGDIEAWACAYLDTLLHVDDWQHLMAIQHRHFEQFRQDVTTFVDASMA